MTSEAAPDDRRAPSGGAVSSTAVVIVTHSVEPAVLQRCLRSVRRAGGADRVILVDNGGMATVPEELDVEVVRAATNRGFGAAANAGFQVALQAGADRVALLNDDVEVTEGWLTPLERALDADPRLGAVQPKLLMLETEPPLVNSVGVEIGDDGAGRDIGYGEPDGPEFGSGRGIEAFTGGAVLFRRGFLDATGGFDERYFLYYEDVDLALRGAELGWSFRCEPASHVWHAPGSSTGRIGDRLTVLRERNRLWAAVRFAPARVVAAAFWLSVRRLRHEPRRAHARGLLGGIVGAPRLLIERWKAPRSR